MKDKTLNLPKVSIVIPTYNTGRYVLDAIDSVKKQTYQNVELIVVDDGSTDDTSDLLKSLPDEFLHFRQENAGQSAAMNFGWKQSTGDLLGYLSADDRLHPTAIEKIVSLMQSSPETVLAYPDFCVIDEHSSYVRTINAPDFSSELLVANFQCLPGPGALFKRSTWEQVGDWNTALRSIPDMDFFLRLCQRGPFIRVPEALADFRIHSGSTTYNRSTAQRSDEPVQVIESFFNSADLPKPYLRWKKRATANALMLSGFMHGFSGRYSISFKRMARAATLHPSSIFSRKMISYVIGIYKSKSVKK